MANRKQCFSQEEQNLTEFADVALAGYALLRLSPSGWRSVARQLTAPITRLHELRNARTRVWRRAVGQMDCGDMQTGGGA